MSIHVGETFDAADWRGKDMSGQKFICCQLNHVLTDAETKLYGTTFISCVAHYWEAEAAIFEHFSAQFTDFRHGNFKGSMWLRSRAQQCDFTWSHFGQADISDFDMTGSTLHFSHLEEAGAFNLKDRDQIAEFLRAHANGNIDVLMAAAYIKTAVEFCWHEWRLISQFPQNERLAKIAYPILKKMPGIEKITKDIPNEGGPACLELVEQR